MTVLDDWVTAVCAELDLDPAGVPVPTVLDGPGAGAHRGVGRGARVPAHLWGGGGGGGADPAAAAERLSALAGSWPVDLGGSTPAE